MRMRAKQRQLPRVTVLLLLLGLRCGGLDSGALAFAAFRFRRPPSCQVGEGTLTARLREQTAGRRRGAREAPSRSARRAVADLSATRLLSRANKNGGSSDGAPDNGLPTENKSPSSSWNSGVGSTLLSSPSRSLAFTAVMAVCGAALGPFLDSYHSSFGVLRYDAPFTLTLWGTSDHPALITTSWVPGLFGLAGIIIGWLYVALDAVLLDRGGGERAGSTRLVDRPSISPPRILAGISIFTFQYWLSGALFASGSVDRTAILNVMSVLAAAGFLALDGSVAGLIASSATAVGGPLIEVALLSLSRLDFMGGSGYHYADPGETGFFPLWIAPVYFLGGPAVGNLARGVWKALSSSAIVLETLKSTTASPVTPLGAAGCRVCGDTRQVACPNCDGVGTYIASGGRPVSCTSCRGRGFVVCRSCFSFYGEDPYDIEAIRDLMSRRPD